MTGGLPHEGLQQAATSSAPSQTRIRSCEAVVCGSLAGAPAPGTMCGVGRAETRGTRHEGEATMSDKRVALVTGGARGIGAAITEALARGGVHVAAGYSRNRAAAEGLAERLTAEGLSIAVHQGTSGSPRTASAW